VFHVTFGISSGTVRWLLTIYSHYGTTTEYDDKNGTCPQFYGCDFTETEVPPSGDGYAGAVTAVYIYWEAGAGINSTRCF
jgi:hypothetical protein